MRSYILLIMVKVFKHDGVMRTSTNVLADWVTEKFGNGLIF